MGKLTCKYLKSILPVGFKGLVYKSGSDVRINLEHVSDENLGYLRMFLGHEHNIILFRDDLVHLPKDYIARFGIF